MNKETSLAKILLVDDRPENLMVLQALLEPLGQTLIKAHNGAEALKMLLLHDFAVILLDVQLPDINGFEVAQLIKSREKTRHIPIIFITAISTDMDNVSLGYSTGAVDYISKPFNPEILTSKVSVFIDLYLKGEQIKLQAERLRANALREAERHRKEKEHELEHKHHLELTAAYAREKRIADVLQRSFLLAPPDGFFPGVSIATLYQAASDEAKVGGDFFDVFSVGADKVALVVGDVTGKGLQAAARTAEVKYSLRAFLRECPVPRNALSRLNRTLLTQWKDDFAFTQAFVCVSIVVFDTIKGSLDCSCAGSEPPVILRSNGQCDIIDSQGMPLGVDLIASYASKEYTIRPGDAVIMVTDGITEARSGNNFFGIEHLTETLNSTTPSDSVNKIAEAVLRNARQFEGGQLKDDACIIVAQYDGAPDINIPLSNANLVEAASNAVS